MLSIEVLVGPRLKSEEDDWLSGGAAADPRLLRMGMLRFRPLNPGFPFRKLCIFISRLGEGGSNSSLASASSEDWLVGFSAGRREGLTLWEPENPKELVGGLKLELGSPTLCPEGTLLTEVEETSAEEEEFGE